MNKKRVLAILALVAIIALYLITLIFSIIGDPQSGTLFRGAIFCIVIIPIMIYGYTLIIKAIRGPKKHNDDDSDDDSDDQADA